MQLVSPYVLFDLKKKTFFVLSKQDQVWVSREQSLHLLYDKDDINNEADVNSGVWAGPSEVDTANTLVTYLNLDHIGLEVSNDTLHKTLKGWTGLA